MVPVILEYPSLHSKLTSNSIERFLLISSKIGLNFRAEYNNSKKIIIFILLFLGNVVEKCSRNFLRAGAEV
jgi:hypothetical protein